MIRNLAFCEKAITLENNTHFYLYAFILSDLCHLFPFLFEQNFTLENDCIYQGKFTIKELICFFLSNNHKMLCSQSFLPDRAFSTEGSFSILIWFVVAFGSFLFQEFLWNLFVTGSPYDRYSDYESFCFVSFSILHSSIWTLPKFIFTLFLRRN